MNLQAKVMLISFVAAVIAAFLFSWADSYNSALPAFMMHFGLIGFFGGLLQAIAGLFLLFKKDKRYAQGFLMSGGLLMVIGFTTCTGSVTMG